MMPRFKLRWMWPAFLGFTLLVLNTEGPLWISIAGLALATLSIYKGGFYKC